MATIVEEQNALLAWQRGCNLLLKETESFNLVTVVTDPVFCDNSWFRDYNPKSVKPEIQSLSDVVTTIFPYKFVDRGYSRSQFYQRYQERHERAKRIHQGTRTSWGTYFLRMTSFGVKRVNQLDDAIEGIRSWTRNHKAAMVIHTSSAETDSVRKHTGNPCLQYIELLCPDAKTISLMAVYRNHDYFGKVLGNFIGLGQLLSFICQETGRNPGPLVCHSAHAYAESSKTQLKKLARI